jgi:hypothetical protein
VILVHRELPELRVIKVIPEPKVIRGYRDLLVHRVIRVLMVL